MYEFFNVILSPIIFLIETYFQFLSSLIGSQGISVIITSFTASILLIPLVKVARKKEIDANNRISIIDHEISYINPSLKGEKRFNAIEGIYKKYKFHPIENLYTGLSFFVIFPILISAFLFFSENLSLMNSKFLGFNLNEPDKIFFEFNILPLSILVINFIDAKYKFINLDRGKTNYLVLSSVICLLIFNMPSCLTLYWLSSSVFSLFFSLKEAFLNH